MTSNLPSEKARYNFCMDALAKKMALERDYLALGGMLYTIREENLYEGNWSSWEEYQMEFKMDASKISRLISIYEVFSLRFRISQAELAEAGGWTVLGDLLPVVKKDDVTKEKVRELLSIAKVQPRVHLQQTIKEIKRGKPCGHKNTHQVVIEYCDDCGARLEAHTIHEKD